MQYNFDRPIERRGTDSHKWSKFGDGVIPMWVADMDFISAEPIIRALRERVEHGVYGYTRPTSELRDAIRERMQRLYNWEIRNQQIIFLPGLVTGLNVAFHAYVREGEEVLVQTPVYHHFITDPIIHGRGLAIAPLAPRDDTYEIDFDAMEKAITPRTKLFILCNPHNPVGRVYTRTELERMAEICLRHNLIICSDEIHCDLIYPGHRHIPIASLGREVAERTVTLMAPSKTFNLAGLGCGFAIAPNPGLKSIWEKTSQGLIPGVNIMGHVAALAAFRKGGEWLDQARSYLLGNRDYLRGYLAERLPFIRMAPMEGTYLAWLDCRQAGIPGDPCDFLLQEAKVALNNGRDFGPEGEGFVRLNFACPRSTLIEALDRMAGAVKG